MAAKKATPKPVSMRPRWRILPEMATVSAPSTEPNPEQAISQPSPAFIEPELHLCEVGDKGDEREAEEAGEGGHPDEDVHLAIAAQVGEAAVEALPHALVTVEIFFGVLDADEAPRDGEEAEAVEEEVAGHAEEGHGVSAQGGAEDARGVELRGVERDGVGEVFALDELGHEGLVAGRVHGHRYAVAEGDGGDSPDGDVVKECEARENECQHHHDGLGDEEQAALVDAVCDDSAEKGYEKERDLSGEADDA